MKDLGHAYDDRDWCRLCGIGRHLVESAGYPCESGVRNHPRCQSIGPFRDQCTRIRGYEGRHSNERGIVELREWPQEPLS